MNELEQLLDGIKAHLSGDKEKDLAYLQAQIEAFRGHEFGGEIAKACSQMMYDMMSDKERDEAVVEMGKDRVVEIRPEEEDEEDCQYFSFYEFFEEVMVHEFVKPQKTVKRSDTPHADIYWERGTEHMRENHLEAAKECFEQARVWNPVNPQVAFSYIDCLIKMDLWEDAHRIILDILQYAFRPDSVATSFTYLGKYYLHMENRKAAAACFHIVRQYVPEDPTAIEELGKLRIGMKQKDIERVAEKNHFLPGANPAILALATGLGEQLFGQQMIEGAIYCYTIVYGLTRDEKIKELLDGLAKMNM